MVLLVVVVVRLVRVAVMALVVVMRMVLVVGVLLALVMGVMFWLLLRILGTVADGLEPEALGMGTAVAARIESDIAGKIVAAGSAIAVVALGSPAQGSLELLAGGGHCR